MAAVERKVGAKLRTPRRSCRARMAMSLPGLLPTLAGAALWAATMAVSALAGLLAHGWKTPQDIAVVVLVFALGAALAFPTALIAASLIAGNRPQARFAAAMIAFSVATIGVTALLYALDYRSYYANWHGEPFTYIWANQFVFTVAGALVQFAATGMRLYFPLGFAALFAVSVWFARRPH